MSLKQWSLQKKIMLGLGVYLVLALVVGVQYALKPYYEGYKMVQQTLGSLSDADQRFLAELMRELDEERRNPGSAGAGGLAGGGAGSAGGLAGGSAGGSLDGSAAGLDPGQYLPGAYDANGLPITGITATVQLASTISSMTRK